MLASTFRQAGILFNGWRNWLIRRPEVEALAVHREAVCNACEHRPDGERKEVRASRRQ